MGAFGIHRVAPSEQRGVKGGVAVILPVWASKGRRYDVIQDEIVYGWWFAAVRLGFEVMRFGLGTRLTWGWVRG